MAEIILQVKIFLFEKWPRLFYNSRYSQLAGLSVVARWKALRYSRQNLEVVI